MVISIVPWLTDKCTSAKKLITAKTLYETTVLHLHRGMLSRKNIFKKRKKNKSNSGHFYSALSYWQMCQCERPKTLTASACPERGFCASSTGWWTTDSGESAAPASRGCLSSSSPASLSPSRWPRTWSQTPAAPGGPGGCWWSPGPAVPASRWVRRQGTWRPMAWFPRRKKHASNISGVTGKKNWK